MILDRCAVLAVAVGFVGLSADAAIAQGSALRIVVIAGEDAVNVIQQKTAVAPVVEVRDRNDLPVAGATVVFAVNGQGATFGGSTTLSVVTNAAGRATANGLTPSAAGTLRMTATASFNGQTATVAITQSNVMTTAEAARAAQSGSTASGGGASAGKVIAIVGGIAAAATGAAVAAGASKGDSPSSSSAASPTNPTPPSPPGTTTPNPPAMPPPTSNRAPVIHSATITPDAALVGFDTPIMLQVQATDADDDPLTYLWEFPDGSRSDQRAFTRTFHLGGTWRIRITVSDGKTSTSSELTLEMKTFTGTWEMIPGSVTAVVQIDLVQSGNTITGRFFNVQSPEIPCLVRGSVRQAAPQLQFDTYQCTAVVRANGSIATLTPAAYVFTLGSDIDTLTGTGQILQEAPRPFTLRRRR